MKFIIKLFPEVMVKGIPVKKKMISQLHDNLRTILIRIDANIQIQRFWDKIEIVCDKKFHKPIKSILTQTSGIDQILEVLQFEFKTMQDIANIAVKENALKIKDKMFLVRIKRKGEHDFTSHELERFVGSELYKYGNPKGVSIKQPEILVQMEVEHQQLYLITKRYRGLGGFPMGMQGEALSLMSGGFDSSVASYLTMKRGIKTHFIFFNRGGNAHEIGVKQVALYLWSKYSSSHRVQFISVPFAQVVTEMFNSIHESYLGVTLKAFMLQAAEKIADDMKIDALITGESVAQVSSQTLRNLALIDKNTTKLILRPLIAMNKNDIINIAGAIGTKDFASSMPEYCGVISKNPVTAGSFKRMSREIDKFDLSVLENAVNNKKIIPVDKIISDVNSHANIEIIHELQQEHIIDIREDIERKRNPLSAILPQTSETKIIEIPFHLLNQKFKQLDQTKQYALFCDRGVMSQLHAEYLKEVKFNNVKVFRPL